jgi:hypothetical protein
MEEYGIALETTSKHRFTNKAKKIYFTLQEAAHSSTISLMYEKALKENKYNIPIKVNYKKKDIILFQTLLYKPSSYEKLNDKKYYAALSLADQFKAPIVYAELLNAKLQTLPKEIITLIIQKYLSLHDIPNALFDKIIYDEQIKIIRTNYDLFSKKSINIQRYIGDTQYRKQMIINNYTLWAKAVESSKINCPINITLPQAVLLSLICNARIGSRILMQLTPSIIGFQSIISLPKNIESLLTILSVETFYNESLAGNKMLTEVDFNI